MYFFDTYALIEVFRGNPEYVNYNDFPLKVSQLNVGEFYIYLIRTKGLQEARSTVMAASFDIQDMTTDVTIAAADFKIVHKKKKLSWADCVGYVVAKKLSLKFLTGDSQFKGMANVEFVK